MAETRQLVRIRAEPPERCVRRTVALRGELLPRRSRRRHDPSALIRLAQRMVSRTYASHTSRCLPADACALDVLA